MKNSSKSFVCKGILTKIRFTPQIISQKNLKIKCSGTNTLLRHGLRSLPDVMKVLQNSYNRVTYVIFSHLTISKRYLDALVIQKFAKHDESKIKELQLSIEKLTEERNKARKALETETTDTLSAQIELEKIADEFRTAHNSRKVRNF